MTLRYINFQFYSILCLSSVILVHLRKAVGWNEMPLCRDTRVIPSNIVLDRGPGPSFKPTSFPGRVS